MPYGRQLRLDRRRRVLRDNILRNAPEAVAPKPSSRATRAERTNSPAPSHSAVTLVGYSQEVRGPCQQRLVHFIPVHPGTLASVIGGIVVAIGLLIGLHYAVWIAGPDSWRSTPLSLLLDVRSRVGLAGWINVQLWLVTAILCGMTFQIRKHRLDDYRAHYRVWLWLALASLLASIEAGTGLTQVLAASIERFGRLNFGWSGRTLVEISIATAVGMLALRICSELRASPVSQVLWLIGLICWIPSALLASQLIKTTLRADYAHLYIGALWLIGKTFVMLASLIYLRQVYIAAQRRFVERSRLTQTGWKMNWPKLRREQETADEELESQPVKERKTRRKRPAEIESGTETEEDNQPSTSTKPKRRLRLPNIHWAAFSKWVASGMNKVRLPKIKLKRNKHQTPSDDSAPESTSINTPSAKTTKATAAPKKQETDSESAAQKPKRRWRIPRPNFGAMFAFRKWIRLPKLSSLNPLSRMRLKPPTPADTSDQETNSKNASSTSSPTSSRNNGPLPSTAPSQRPSTQPNQGRTNQAAPLSQANRAANQHDDEDDDDDDSDNPDRKLSKAERKRLKRMQQEQRRNAA